MLLIKFIKSQPVLFALFLICIISAFLINFPLSKIPTFWNYGFETGKIIYDLSVGFIISYIFYFIVVFLKEEKDRKAINSRVSFQATLIIGEGYSLFFNVFHNYKRRKRIFPPEKEEIIKGCETIDVFKSPVQNNVGGFYTWKWLIDYHVNNVQESINKIKSLPYINSELFGILTEFEDSKLFFMKERMIFPQVRTEHFKDGTFMVEHLTEYFLLISKLDNYLKKNYSDFSNDIKSREERKKLFVEF